MSSESGLRPLTSGKAVASLVCGLLGLVGLAELAVPNLLWWLVYLYPAAFLAIILGHWSRADLRKSVEPLKGSGMARAGLVLGYLNIVLLVVGVVFLAGFERSDVSPGGSNEASAIGTVRSILTAEVTYSATYPKVGFTCRLEELGTGSSDWRCPEAGPSSSGACLIDHQVAVGRKSGYLFTLSKCSAEKPGGPMTSFQLLAVPQVKGTTGVRTFCADQSGVLKSDESASADLCLSKGRPLQ